MPHIPAGALAQGFGPIRKRTGVVWPDRPPSKESEPDWAEGVDIYESVGRIDSPGPLRVARTGESASAEFRGHPAVGRHPVPKQAAPKRIERGWAESVDISGTVTRMDAPGPMHLVRTGGRPSIGFRAHPAAGRGSLAPPSRPMRS